MFITPFNIPKAFISSIQVENFRYSLPIMPLQSPLRLNFVIRTFFVFFHDEMQSANRLRTRYFKNVFIVTNTSFCLCLFLIDTLLLLRN